MCDTSAYCVKGAEEELILNSLQNVEVREDNITIRNIFGETKSITGKILRIDYMENKLLIEV